MFVCLFCVCVLFLSFVGAQKPVKFYGCCIIAHIAYAVTNKTNSFLSSADAHVYVCTSTVCCFYILDSDSVHTRGDKQCPLSGVAKCGRERWRRAMLGGLAQTLTLLGAHYSEHAPSIAFRDPPPYSGTIGYATDWALFISAQLSTDAGSALQRAWVLIRL